MACSLSSSFARILVFVAGCWGIVLVGTVPTAAQDTRTITKTLDQPTDGTVKVIAERGRIKVQSWERPEVEVQAKVREWPSQQADRAPVSVTKEENEVRIETADADPDGAGFWRLVGLAGADGPDVSYSLRVPASTSLRVTTQEGRVDVQGLESEVVVEGYSASVAVRDLTGEVTAATFSGPLRAENVTGPLTIATFSGDMTVQGPSPSAEHTLASFSGDAEITFPADAAFDLRTDVSWGGSVSSGFPMPDSTNQDDESVPIGGGGPRVTFESFSGSLTLRAE